MQWTCYQVHRQVWLPPGPWEALCWVIGWVPVWARLLLGRTTEVLKLSPSSDSGSTVQLRSASLVLEAGRTYLPPSPWANKVTFLPWLEEDGVKYGIPSASSGMQIRLSLAQTLCQQDCLWTMAERGWSPVTGPFPNIQLDQFWWAYLQGLLGHG